MTGGDMLGGNTRSAPQHGEWPWSRKRLIAVGTALTLLALAWFLRASAAHHGVAALILQVVLQAAGLVLGLTFRWGPRSVVALAVLILAFGASATVFVGIQGAYQAVFIANTLLLGPTLALALGCLLRRTVLARWLGKEA